MLGNFWEKLKLYLIFSQWRTKDGGHVSRGAGLEGASAHFAVI